MAFKLSPALRCLPALLLTLLISSALDWRPAAAQQIVHVVQPGENLFRIGLRYGVSWQAIMDANGLASTNIHVGDRLIIPGRADATPFGGQAATPSPLTPTATPLPPPAEATPTPPPVENPPPTESAPPATTYVVQPGDTLSLIARRFGVDLLTLASANNLYNLSLIYVGQTLAIPGGAPAQPAPALPVDGAKRIEVDISEQHMYVYQGEVLVYSFVVSTGEPGRGTATGTFSVLNKIPNAYASLWDLQMPNWLGIYWVGRFQNGIHALPILSNGVRLWSGYLGTPVSYGCVILGVQESQLLYDWADIGTPVIIRW